MRGEDDGAPLGAQSPDHPPHLPPGAGVQAGGRFVQEHDAGVVHHGGGDADALLEAAGQVLEVGVPLVLQVDEGDELVHVSPAVVHAGEEGYVLSHREEVEGIELLRQHSYLAPDLLAAGPEIVPKNGDLPLGGLADALQYLHGGRLARAVRPQDGEDLSALYVQIDIVDRDQVLVALDQAPHRYDVLLHCNVPFLSTSV